MTDKDKPPVDHIGDFLQVAVWVYLIGCVAVFAYEYWWWHGR